MGIFENATFGTLFETRDGGKAVYIAYVEYNHMHKLYVQGFEFTLLYNADGKRRGGGRYAQKYGSSLDIVKQAS